MTTLEFWQRHAGLVWSNPEADDSVHIRAALMRPRFTLLLDIATEFGLERLMESVRASATTGAAAVVNRLIDDLRNFVGAQPQNDDITVIAIRKT